MATIFRGDTRRTVRNLGWLLRHRREVDYIGIEPSPRGGALMVADLTIKGELTIYHTDWASMEVCRAWLGRRGDLLARTRFYNTDGEVAS